MKPEMSTRGRVVLCSWTVFGRVRWGKGGEEWEGRGLTGMPGDDGEIVAVARPLERVLRAAQLLELHRELALLHLVVREHLEVAREPDLLRGPDEPLCRVVLVPAYGVPVVHRELVVEVVVALADGDERGDEVVPRRVLVVERRLAQPVRERVHAERRLRRAAHESGMMKKKKKGTHMVHEHQAQHRRVHVPAGIVPPQHPGHGGREHEADEEDERDKVLVLPAHDGALGEVADVREPGPAPRLDEQPAHVGVREAALGVVRVELGVGVAVVRAVAAGPPLDGALDGTRAGDREEVLQRLGRVVRAVRPEAVVPSGNACYIWMSMSLRAKNKATHRGL